MNSWDCYFFFFKQKTAYEMRISDWSSDVCSSDLRRLLRRHTFALLRETHQQFLSAPVGIPLEPRIDAVVFYLPLFHLVGGGIGQVARYRLHGLVDTKEMGTDRTSAEIRSEERRVGKECVRTCRSRWSPVH